MGDEDKGFEVKDRRLFDDEGNTREEAASQDAPTPEAEASPPPEEYAGQKAGPLPPPDISGLIVSLSHAAMMHLGQVSDLHTGEAGKPDLALARHTIDTIGMLQEKTKGNLSDEEQRLLDHALSDLRLLFVRVAQNEGGG